MGRSTEQLLAEARGGMPSGHYLPPRARNGAVRVLVVAVGHDPAQLEALADELAWLQVDRPYIKPVLLLNSPDVAPVRRRGFVYETAVDPATWPAYDATDGSYDTYVQQRVIEMVRVYEPHHTVVAEPERPLPRWPFAKSLDSY
ncbi:hypothetical protein [Phytoactinopolyspora halotolerans]|uniref:Uncharacterized protein n=1 Tax=Phytoactinopolyspora halotolerans TaxID=1981512 RepID=A0A6L9SAC3_9ACTN|nr:hypothetical protein [Phytoactinopolyspora halotolerans]NEE01448.1 hypothetical protein [Phytoactinopolyspora halotolerans]